MQTAEEHHAEVVKGLYDQLKPVLDSSEPPVYIYLDNSHKASTVDLPACWAISRHGNGRRYLGSSKFTSMRKVGTRQ